jgi:cellobiose phosphorylase
LSSDVPQGNILSNGRLTSVVYATGASRLTFDGMSVNRWRRSSVTGPGTSILFVRDVESGEVWRASGSDDSNGRVVLSPGVVRFEVRRQEIESALDVFVAQDINAEVRHLTLRNGSDRRRSLDVTSYLEVALGPYAADAAHPAFAKLFVQTAFDTESQVIRAWRRLRSPDEREAHLVHTCRGDGNPSGFETSRFEFVGRGRSIDQPHAVEAGVALNGTTGSVLDPVAALRRSIVLHPGEEASITFFTGVARSEDDQKRVLAGIDVFEPQDEYRAAAARELERELLSHIEPRRARYYRQLATSLFTDDPRLRAPAELVARLDAPISKLGDFGVDAELPLVVARVAGPEDMKLVRSLLKAHRYWRSLGLSVNLFFLNDITETEAAEQLQIAIEEATTSFQAPVHVKGGVFSEYADDMLAEEQVLLQSHASILIREAFPPLEDPIQRPTPIRRFIVPGRDLSRHQALEPLELRHQNGYGGFSADGREYVIEAKFGEDGHVLPPQPWTNVIASESVGFLVSETGGGYTWSQNSRENRITPWSNDVVTDPAGELCLLRDEEAGEVWNLAPGIAAAPTDYRVRHGLGYSVFESAFSGLRQSVTLFVDGKRSAKISRITIENTSGRERTLSVVGAHRLVLGADEEAAPRLASLRRHASPGALVARNCSNGEFRQRRIFSTLLGDGPEIRQRIADRFDVPTLTADYEGDGDVRGNVAVHRAEVSLEPGASVVLHLVLGDAANESGVGPALSEIVDALKKGDILDETKQFWSDLVSGVQVSTPSPEIDLMVNGWLPYQNLSCRIWGRSAFYQSGGAFGYRDQLQDSSAMLLLDPDITRRQILLHAEQQFVEGDVMHWWHPPTGKGIRTRFSDDLLWLPYITATYVEATGDASVLDEKASFIKARTLVEGEDEVFLQPERLDRSASVYEHCCLALDRSLTRGAHGLPLIGTGDWNDGMNRVGREGRGESVWLGFFIAHIIDRMLPFCEARGDADRVERYRNYRSQLQRQLNDTGWDGEWYRRAYYDNGAPLGSKESDEAKIDALAQAWAVISGVAPPERGASALDAMERELVDEEAGIIRLLAPAFDKTPHDPGYIKGYVPGVRENGGQYTHAALWAVKALAEAGRKDRAARLLAMLSPVYHARSKEAADRYRVEPYVIAADVYGEPPHVGRGGWTWYTGSAGWMYRVATESILGLKLVGGEAIEIDPVIPTDWPGFSLSYRLPGESTTYQIEVVNGNPVKGLEIDGVAQGMDAPTVRIPIIRDGQTHRVIVNV